MASMQLMRRESAFVHEVTQDSPKSPEARLGMKVEDLWDVQEPQLTPTEKLNACFEGIPVSAFPPAPSSQVIEIKSDTSLAEAVRILAEHKILSAPVVDVDAPEDASWIDRYIGVVEFAGIIVWILHQSEPPSPRSPTSGSALEAAVNRVTNAASLGTLGPEDAAATSGNFFEALTSSEFYKNTKVRDIAGSFRWAPFLALQKSNSFLTMLLLLSSYKMKSIPESDSAIQRRSKFRSHMAKASLIWLLLSILYIASTANCASTATRSSSRASNFIKASCSATTYPALCVQSLSLYASSINQSPRQLIQTALSVSLDKAQSTKTFVYKLTKFKGIKPREKAAIKDCFEEIDDTLDKLVKSVKELKSMGSSKGQDYQWHISNVQTWISAALTDENTCVDGFAGKALDGRVKNSITARFVHVERVTSNALALINKFGSKY